MHVFCLGRLLRSANWPLRSAHAGVPRFCEALPGEDTLPNQSAHAANLDIHSCLVEGSDIVGETSTHLLRHHIKIRQRCGRDAALSANFRREVDVRSICKDT
jgi:hypothetical protein